MRRILLIISLVSAAFVGANAQPGNVRFGIKMGPTIDWASSGSTATTNDGIRLGGNFGLVCDYYLTSNVAVSSGVDFNFLRLKYTFVDRRRAEDFLEESNISVSRRLKTANIEIPLKFKVRMDVLDAFKAYAEAGAGLSLNCKDYVKDSYSFYWTSYEGQSYVDCRKLPPDVLSAIVLRFACASDCRAVCCAGAHRFAGRSRRDRVQCAAPRAV